MPNIAHGTILIAGNRANIEAFAARLDYDSDGDRLPESCLAAIPALSKAGCEDAICSAFRGKAESEKSTVRIGVSFVWSAYHSLIGGIPRQGSKYISLRDACIAGGVDVEITASEFLSSLHEHITCDARGQLSAERGLDNRARCKKCGTIRELVEWAEDFECRICGSSDYEMMAPEMKNVEDLQNG